MSVYSSRMSSNPCRALLSTSSMPDNTSRMPRHKIKHAGHPPPADLSSAASFAIFIALTRMGGPLSPHVLHRVGLDFVSWFLRGFFGDDDVATAHLGPI